MSEPGYELMRLVDDLVTQARATTGADTFIPENGELPLDPLTVSGVDPVIVDQIAELWQARQSVVVECAAVTPESVDNYRRMADQALSGLQAAYA